MTVDSTSTALPQTQNGCLINGLKQKVSLNIEFY
jgi:hypothetical protein